MRIIVREAVLEDAPLIANLTRKAWAGKCPPTSRGHRDTWVNVNEDLHAGGAFILLVDDIPAGSLRWAPLDEDENVWKIRRLGVIPAFCGQNLSQHLIEAGHTPCPAVRNRRAPSFPAPISGTSDQLYEAYGFELAPEIEFSTRDTLDLPPIMMRKTLES